MLFLVGGMCAFTTGVGVMTSLVRLNTPEYCHNTIYAYLFHSLAGICYLASSAWLLLFWLANGDNPFSPAQRQFLTNRLTLIILGCILSLM